MAKRKKRKGKRKGHRGKKKKSVSRKHKTPLAATLGGVKTAYDVGTMGTFTDLKVTAMRPCTAALKVTGQNLATRLKTPGVADPLILGLIVSYGDKIPVVGKLYKPVKKELDKLVRQIFGKSWKA